MNRFLQAGLLMLSLLAAALFFAYSHLFYCQTVAYSGFREIAPRVYVSPEFPARHHQYLAAALRQAQTRITDFWGKPQGTAVLIFCANLAEYEKYSHSRESAGFSMAAPYGHSFIVLSPNGLNPDVISHEMCHDELFARLGWWQTTFQIPQWFHEGLALMFDTRFIQATDSVQRFKQYASAWRYRIRHQAHPPGLEALSTMKGFFPDDPQQVTRSYLTAGTEVSYWLLFAGREGLFELIGALQENQAFEIAYSAIESRKKKHHPHRGLRNPVRPARRDAAATP